MNNLVISPKAPLNFISETEALSPSDLEVFKNFQDILVDNFKKAQIFRTRTEMIVSVLNDLEFPTPDAKYWQAVKEQDVMYSELSLLMIEYRKISLEIKETEKAIRQTSNPVESDLMQFSVDRMRFILAKQRRIAQDRLREIQEWQSIKEELEPQMKYGTEGPDAHQLESYSIRWQKQAAVMGNSGTPSERHNLFGQIETAQRISKGMLGE